MGLCHSSSRVSDNYIDIKKVKPKPISLEYKLLKELKENIIKVINKISNAELDDIMYVKINPKIRDIDVINYANGDMRGVIFDFVDGNHLEIYISAMSFFKNEDINILKISCNGYTLFFPQTKLAMYKFTIDDNLKLDDSMLMSEINDVDYITSIYTPILMNILTD